MSIAAKVVQKSLNLQIESLSESRVIIDESSIKSRLIKSELVSTKSGLMYERRTEMCKLFSQDDKDEVEMTSIYFDDLYVGSEEFAEFIIGKLGIKPEKSSPDHSVCGIGKSIIDGKYYGWSHRAIVGFGIGDKIFDPSYGGSDTLYTQHGSDPINTDDDAKRSAIRFAEYVS